MRVVFDGAHGLTTQKLNEGATAYAGAAKKWDGVVSVDVTFDLPQSTIPADDDADWLTLNGTPSGKGAIVLRSIDIHQFDNFVACITAEGQGVRFGEDLPVVTFGFSIDENVSDGDALKHIFYKCRATSIPSFSAATRKTDAFANRDITIPIAVSPVYYEKAGGKKGRAIYDILHSGQDAARFAANETAIVFPVEIAVE